MIYSYFTVIGIKDCHTQEFPLHTVIELRPGWMVLAESYRVEKGEVLMTVHSLHQDEHHRNGDIRVTSKENRPSIRQLIFEHSRRSGLTIVLSADDLATRPNILARTHHHNRTTLSRLHRLHGTPNAFWVTDPPQASQIICEFDFSTLKPTTTRCPHSQQFVSITCRKGQERIIEDHGNSTTEQTDRRHPRGVATKKSRPLTKVNTFPLDESRCDLLQLETSLENVIQDWIQS